MSITNIITIIFVCSVAVYTVTYGIFEWKNKNKLGAIAIFFYSIITIGFPLYLVLLK